MHKLLGFENYILLVVEQCRPVSVLGEMENGPCASGFGANSCDNALEIQLPLVNVVSQ